jgi:endonuclease I
MGATANVPAGPADGTSYVVGNSVANGTVVYKGNSNTFDITGLTAGTSYWFYVWPLNDACTGGPLYNRTSPLSGNLITSSIPACVAPTQAPTALLLTPGSTSVSGSYAASGSADTDSYLVVYSTNSNPGFTPVDGTAYTPGQTIGSVTVAKSGTGTTFAANALMPSTPYYFFVYSMNSIGCTGGPLYFTTSLNGTTTTLAPNNNIPAGFYDTTMGKSCADLKSALKWRTSTAVNASPITPRSYGDLWIQYLISDVKPREVGSGSANVIWDIYSDNPTGPDPYNFTPGPVSGGGQQDNGTNAATEGILYNREHTVPLDWFDGNTSNDGPATDYYHILPTDKWVNALRSSFIYGEVTNPTTTSLNGSKLGPNAFAGLTGTAFEPINEYKGDVARAFLYFVTRYEASMTSFSGGTEGTKAFEPNAFPSVDIPYLQLMLKWHSQDPVSQKELDRNEAGFGYQSNRNPFVDHPEYAGIIWNATCPGLGALPVNISWFKGTLKGTNVELNWAAANEINFNRYEVQRSVNGTSFETIGTLKARNAGKYAYTDNVAALGDRRLYYRLKLIDNDGSSKYSAVYSVHVKANTPFQVYPNPASSSLTIELGSTPFTGSISISDMTGRILISKQVQQVSGAFLLPVQQLSTGRYQLKLMSSKATGINSSVPVNIVR